MKEHHQIQSHTNAVGRQGLRLTLQLRKMDNLNVSFYISNSQIRLKNEIFRLSTLSNTKPAKWRSDPWQPRAW